MHLRRWTRPCRTAVALLVLVLVWTALHSLPALAQSTPAAPTDLAGAAQAASSTVAAADTGQSLPTIWFLLAAGLAMLVPAGFVLLAVATLEQSRAWNTALGGLAAAGLAAFAYWAIGFALHFGGVGLVYPQPELHGLVLEWSPLSSEWGIGWGMAGLSGWFLAGDVTALAYALFLAHLPWVMLAALLPVMALRGRAPSTVTLVLAILLGGVIFPLAGNWVQGGGWLNALGRNMGLGHGFVDPGGAGSVHLVAAGFALAALTVWSTRRSGEGGETQLPPAHQPLLAVVGALLILGGAIGWLYANPLQSNTMGALGLFRGAVVVTLAAAGGLVFPLLYTWFVTGSSDPTLTARGFAGGLVAGLACGPFVQPGIALLIGMVAGASVPFVTFLLDGRLRIQDRTGVVASSGVPALIGLLLVGIFADGAVGAGWQQTGIGSFLGVTGQGVSGLTVASGLQADFPGQVQAQVIGMAALALWGFVSGLIVCVPLGLIFHSLLQHDAPAPTSPAWSETPAWSEAPPLVAAGRLPQPVEAGRGAFAAGAAVLYSTPPPERTTTESPIVQPLAQPNLQPLAGADPYAGVPYAYENPRPPGFELPAPPVEPDSLESSDAPAWSEPPAPASSSAYADPYTDPYAVGASDAYAQPPAAPYASSYVDPYAEPYAGPYSGSYAEPYSASPAEAQADAAPAERAWSLDAPLEADAANNELSNGSAEIADMTDAAGAGDGDGADTADGANAGSTPPSNGAGEAYGRALPFRRKRPPYTPPPSDGAVG